MNPNKAREFLAEIDRDLAELAKQQVKLQKLRHNVAEYVSEDVASRSPSTVVSSTSDDDHIAVADNNAPLPPEALGSTAITRDQMATMTRDEMTEWALGEIGRPAKVNEIIETLWEAGLALDYKNNKRGLFNILSSTVAKSNKYKNISRGVWWLADREDAKEIGVKPSPYPRLRELINERSE